MSQILNDSTLVPHLILQILAFRTEKVFFHQFSVLLRDNKDPTDAEIRDALSGHICRCGTHARIISAVKKAIRLAQDNTE